MATKIGLYVKRLRGSILSGYMLREQNARIEMALRVDDTIYEEVVQVCQDTNYITVEVTSGVIIE